MQGRLVPPEANRFQSFPRQSWKSEFNFARQAGLDCIEWIYDAYGADVNPLSTDKGISELRTLCGTNNVHVLSVCADYFMDMPFLRITTNELEKRKETLKWLLRRCCRFSINRIVLPFVDASRIDTEEEMEKVISILKQVINVAEETKIELHLETSLPPRQFSDLLSEVQHPLIKANYDSGNSSGLGYDPNEEFAAYGKRIGSIHIKDRVLGAGTVPLGQGDADFSSLFKQVKSIGYSGDFILQVARDIPGNEIKWARKNREFVEKALRGLK